MNPRFLTSRASAGRETQPQSATEPHRRQLPGTCRRKEVNATQIDEHLSSQRLQDFVRCAGMELETAGYFGRYCQVNRNSLFSGSKSILAIVENQRLSWHVNQWNLQ